MHCGLAVTWWSFFAKELLLMAMCNRCSGFGQILLQTSCNLTKLQYFLSPANHGYAAKGKLFLMRLFLFLIFNGRGFGSKCWCRLQERFFWDWKKVGCRIRHLKSATKKVVVQPSSAVFHGILRFYFSWIWLASVYRLKKSKNEKHQELTNERYLIAREDCNWKVQNSCSLGFLE